MPFYKFSAASTLPDDGYNVLAPYVGTGRWVLLRHDAAVLTTAQLAAIPTTQRADGMALYVNAENAWYEFDTGTPTVGDITPTQGTGRWVRVTTPDQLIAPFRKTYNHQDSIALADTHESNYPTAIEYPHRDAIAVADRYTYSLIPAIRHSDAIAAADRFTYSVILPINHRDAIANADRFTYSVILPALHRDAISMADRYLYSTIGLATYQHRDALAIADRTQYQLNTPSAGFDTVIVDNAGNVVTADGFVISTDGAASLDTIVVDSAGNVVTADGFVISTDGNTVFDAIVVDNAGNVVTSDGFVITSP